MVKVRRRPRAQRPRAGDPAQVIAATFAVGIAIGTGLLLLPVSSADGQSASLLDSVFTATSAVCVTGLVTVDTGTSWSTVGHVVILGLMQVGGLSIMTVASLLVVLVSRRLGLRARLVAQAQASRSRAQSAPRSRAARAASLSISRPSCSAR